MTPHCLGSKRCPLVRDALLYADTFRGSRCHRRVVARRPDPLCRIPARGMVACVGTGHFPVTPAAERDDITALFQDVHKRRHPDQPTVWDRYLSWCRSLGRRDIYNRRLGRRFLKTISVRR